MPSRGGCFAARARSAAAAGPRLEPSAPRVASRSALSRAPRCAALTTIRGLASLRRTACAASVAAARGRAGPDRRSAARARAAPDERAVGAGGDASWPSSDSDGLESMDSSDVEEVVEVSEDELDPAERMLVVLTREDGKNADMQAMLSQFGIDSLVLPLIRTEELPAARELAEAVRELPDGSWVCLTSAIAALTLCAHALEPLAERWAREEVRVAVVGVATGRALEERSGGRVVADFVPSTANARTLGVELPLYGRTPGESGETKAGGKTEGGRSTGEATGREAKARGSSGGDSGIPEAGAGPPKAAPDLGSDLDTGGAPRSAPHVLFPASRLALGLLERILRERGAAVRRMEVYGTFPQVVDDARLIRRASLADAVVLASPSAAKAWVATVGPEAALRIPAACIGKTTAEAAQEAGVGVVVAPDQPGQGAVMELLVGGIPGGGDTPSSGRADGTRGEATREGGAGRATIPDDAGIFLPTLGRDPTQ